MYEKIKIKGSLGRGIHYLKKLDKLDGSESYTYKIITDLGYKVINEDRGVNQRLPIVKSVILAGGPELAVGNFMEEVNQTIKYIDVVPGFGITITFEG